MNYHTYQMAFKSYVETRDHQAFNQAVGQATETMQALSAQVRTIEAKMIKDGFPEIASKIREIQDQERVKLQLTLTLQKLHQAFSWKTFSWQQLLDPEEDILEPQKNCCGCSHAHAEGEPHAPSVPEATEIEFSNALKEAMISMDATNMQINDLIDELRQTEIDNQ